MLEGAVDVRFIGLAPLAPPHFSGRRFDTAALTGSRYQFSFTSVLHRSVDRIISSQVTSALR
jgi:hypothetical protein